MKLWIDATNTIITQAPPHEYYTISSNPLGGLLPNNTFPGITDNDTVLNVLGFFFGFLFFGLVGCIGGIIVVLFLVKKLKKKKNFVYTKRSIKFTRKDLFEAGDVHELRRRYTAKRFKKTYAGGNTDTGTESENELYKNVQLIAPSSTNTDTEMEDLTLNSVSGFRNNSSATVVSSVEITPSPSNQDITTRKGSFVRIHA